MRLGHFTLCGDLVESLKSASSLRDSMEFAWNRHNTVIARFCGISGIFL